MCVCLCVCGGTTNGKCKPYLMLYIKLVLPYPWVFVCPTGGYGGGDEGKDLDNNDYGKILIPLVHAMKYTGQMRPWYWFSTNGNEIHWLHG